VDALDLTATVYDEVAAEVSTNALPRIRDVLGIFQLRGDDVFKRIQVLSGGEKARVSLAKILLSSFNFLMMDEPTNHLDMASRDALEQALADYDGTLLIISHDRYFLDKLVHRVIEIKDHQIKQYEGNYSDYLARRESEQKVEVKSNDKPKVITGSKKTKEQKRLEAEARQAISKDRNRLTNEIVLLETKIDELEKRKIEIELQMANPETYQKGGLAISLPYEYTRVKTELHDCYERWEKAQVELEEILEYIA